MAKETLENRLSEKGYRLTNQRKAILQAFTESEKHLLTAQEVFEKVTGAIAQRINFSTVYRNLEILTRLNILNKVVMGQGISGFELAQQDRHHHHLICKTCGKTRVISYCPFEALAVEVLVDFVPTDHKFEVYGYCKGCQK